MKYVLTVITLLGTIANASCWDQMAIDAKVPQVEATKVIMYCSATFTRKLPADASGVAKANHAANLMFCHDLTNNINRYIKKCQRSR